MEDGGMMAGDAIAFAPARRWREPRDTRLLLLDPRRGAWRHGGMADLARVLAPGDVLVVNDAATLPASIAMTTSRGAAVELRLAARLSETRWRALVFGAGSWRVPTESRPPAPLAPGERLACERGLVARVVAVVKPGRLVDVTFDCAGDALWRALYQAGRPIQYSYLDAELPLWAVQNAYAARPWAHEPPSAGRGLTWDLLARLGERGVRTCALTHAAGISSTGDASIDATLPWPERSDIPAATVAAVVQARARGGRVVAVGTSVVRALEGRVRAHGRLEPGEGVTDLVLGAGDRLAIVDGLLTGLHEPTASHFRLLQAFADGALVRGAYADAARLGYLGHELGDANLILPGLADA
jgi:S-adenosylmethionine:tRNA ribosyltransferase-isomerase